MGTFLQIKPGRPFACGSVIKASDFALLLRAKEVLATAQLQAAQIQKQAHEAFAEQKELGLAEGRKQADADNAERIFSAAGDAVDYFSGLESRLIQMVVSGVQKVVGDLTPEERIVGIARNALGELRDQKEVRIRVSPQEIAFVQKRLKEVQSPYPGLGLVETLPDPHLKPGHCILESPLGSVEASAQTQIAALQNALERRMQPSQGV